MIQAVAEDSVTTLAGTGLDTVPRASRPLTVYEVVRRLGPDATPAQQDSAVQAAFPHRPIEHWSACPDTLHLPGLPGSSVHVDLAPYSYRKGYFSADTLFRTDLRFVQPGFAADPVPYRMRSDDYVAGALLLSFFLAVFLLARSRRMLWQQFKGLFYTRRNENLYSDTVSSGLSGRLFFVFLVCFLFGILFFDYTQYRMVEVFNQVSPYILLSLDVGILLVYYVVKLLLYGFVNWLFFTRQQNALWMQAYFSLAWATGFLLLPCTLIAVCFELPFGGVAAVVGALVLLSKWVLCYKCWRLFFAYPHGYLHLILYFCALEMIPVLALWKALVYGNECLVVNI